MRFEMCEIKPLGQRGHTPPVFRHSTVQNASWRYPESPGSSKSAPRRKGACTAASRRVRDLQIGRFWPQVWGGRGVTTAFLFCVLPGDVRRFWEGNTEQGGGPHRLRTAPVDRQPLSQYCLRTVFVLSQAAAAAAASISPTHGLASLPSNSPLCAFISAPMTYKIHVQVQAQVQVV